MREAMALAFFQILKGDIWGKKTFIYNKIIVKEL